MLHVEYVDDKYVMSNDLIEEHEIYFPHKKTTDFMGNEGEYIVVDFLKTSNYTEINNFINSLNQYRLPFIITLDDIDYKCYANNVVCDTLIDYDDVVEFIESNTVIKNLNEYIFVEKLI